FVVVLHGIGNSRDVEVTGGGIEGRERPRTFAADAFDGGRLLHAADEIALPGCGRPRNLLCRVGSVATITLAARGGWSFFTGCCLARTKPALALRVVALSPPADAGLRQCSLPRPGAPPPVAFRR